MSGQDPVVEFLDGLSVQRRAEARAVHDVIRAAAPDLEPWIWRGVMWGGTDQTILGHGRMTQVNRSGKKVEWFVMGLASQKAYLSLYVSAVRDGRYLAQVYGDRLGKVKIGSSSVSFRRLADLDLAVLAELAAEAAGGD
ncbi:protein of unknown function (DU1801) [Asanoa hainanensis]|uniref:YdhG-like domain-containing protein n=1 Tax=Asanoa hainanensis TaxID=560556 RepID=A0A239PCR9_9ACTN|nr:DUF1801 domain-containing protein [Asanoa hainanensis]SNT64418.1 protein of unknown function (DU1801) [Asanoa hainanensis]